MQPILIIATDGFEESELLEPKRLLEESGAKVIIASLERGQIKGWKGKDWGKSVSVDLLVDDVAPDEYAALLLPGGQINPDILRMEDKAVQLVRDFCEAGKPVAAICHGPWLLAEADVIDGKRVTSWPSIRTDLANAGAEVEDAEVVTDGNLITSRNPDDIPAFCDALIAALNDAARLDDAA